MITNAGHLSYCTNIHPGEDWSTHFNELKTRLPLIKKQVSPNKKMGIGLRISHQMSLDLLVQNTLKDFQFWLKENDIYVFTINGFPYGQFHDTVIKDQVHTPDWTTRDRLDYTLRLFDILARLLPDYVKTGGISTSPLSYKHWHHTDQEKQDVMVNATRYILEVATYLHELHEEHGKILHLDIEPEPDGLMENGEEFIRWYEEILLPTSCKLLNDISISKSEPEDIIRRHIQLCYDVCHMAVEFENQKYLTDLLNEKNIPIGKIQLSSALRLPEGSDPEVLRSFDEEQYLHQVVIQKPNGTLKKYKDLPEAFNAKQDHSGEWRVHFHVPLFTKEYGVLSSTQDYLEEILEIHRRTPLTDHLEIETYTWNVLPDELQLPIENSIVREIKTIKKLL